MVRQSYNVNTTEKQLEIYSSFGGGMVTQSHPEKLANNQSVLIENGNIVAGDVIEPRGAYAQTNGNNGTITGKTQGEFQYNSINGNQTLVAINGNLYKVDGNVYTLVSITGLSQFQTTRPIEAVQNRDKLYIATGSGVVIYDGSTAALMTAYAPTGLEALYIGTNGYAANPDNYLSDSTGASDVILGVMPDHRYGIVNQPIVFTAFISKIASDSLEYQFETKMSDAVDYSVDQAWSSSKTFNKTFATKADYMIRVSLRKQGTTVTLSQYILPRYRVNTTPDEKPEPEINFDDLKLCNRIFIHYDRLFLYGDTGNPDFLYVSHLNKFDYIPRTNIIKVTDPLRGALNSVKQYKNFLVCITDGSVQMITGQSPKDFVKQPVHTTLGTKYPYSVQVMKNYIVFVGNDNGVYILKSFNYSSDDKLNVERIDIDIMDDIGGLLKTTTNVLSTIYNNQYYLYIENSKGNYIYRFYYELNIWVRDSISFNLATLNTEHNTLVSTAMTNGTIHQLKDDVFLDGLNTAYNLHIISKDFNFGMPHHRKKLKQYQLLVKMTNKTLIVVSIYADNTLVSTTPLNSDYLQNTDAQKLKISASGRFRYVKTDITIPVNEKVQLIGFGFIYKLNTPK